MDNNRKLLSAASTEHTIYFEDQEEDEIDDAQNEDENFTLLTQMKRTNYSNLDSDTICGVVSRKISIFIAIFVLIMGLVTTAMYTPQDTGVEKNQVDAMAEFVMNTVEGKFKSQEPLFSFSIIAALENLSKHPATPAVYLLLFDEKSKSSAFCVVEMISIAFKKLLPSQQGWLHINGDKLSNSHQSDPGLLMKAISENMNYSRLIVVSDVNKIPSKLVQGFHSLVDQYNPLIRKAVYIFTLRSSLASNNSRPIEVVEDTLNSSWQDLNVNSRSPLIARVTDAILRVNPEPNPNDCELKNRFVRELTKILM